ncbi:MAG: LysR family transcriptional regulator [Rhodospirillales bacterium]|jgi:DNA-binding transcriptional LysR family regulator|nr:LysR family transcriptional regulator [Rhodospirillales bacterium]
MDRFHAIQVFVKVAECRGFAAAARDLAISPPAVTRAVALLEDRLGTRLLVRTTRSVRLTESGERFLQDARRILLELEEAEEAAVGSHAAPRGELHITAPVLFGRMFVTPILGDFLDLFPLVSARTLFVDRVVNLLDEGLDVAIRIGDLPDSSLIAVRAGTVRRVMFASPDYIRTQGLPQRPEDLAGHRLIQSLAMGTSLDWPFQENDVPYFVRAEPRLRMNTNDAVVDLAFQGWGLSRLLSYQIAPYLADGRLQTVLDEFEMPPLPIHVVHQEGRMVSAKVRSFVDYMVERLRADPAIN